jgi:type I restriction enzyme S subunit
LAREDFLSFVLPPASEESLLAVELLEALESRIQRLTETNTTLEAIAQALFKSWFVDFDPVHAKAEGREPEAMDAATAALFPSEFNESELGLIPKGWRTGRLGDISSNPRDQAKPDKIDPDTPYFGLEHMPRKSIALSDHGTANGLGSGKFWFEESDILFGKLRPYFHKVGLAPFKGICSTDILVLRSAKPVFHALLLTHASSDAIIDYATRLSNGAKMPRSSWKDIANYPICVPSDSAAQAFNEAVEPMLERIKANVRAVSTTTRLRDTLLPRLISGKLRLPDAERAIEATV